jgi:hypothetical protein
MAKSKNSLACGAMANRSSDMQAAAESCSPDDLRHIKAAAQLLDVLRSQFRLFAHMFEDNGGGVPRDSAQNTHRAAEFILNLLEKACIELTSVATTPKQLPHYRVEHIFDAFGMVATVCAALEGGRFPNGRWVVASPVFYTMDSARQSVTRLLSALNRFMASAPEPVGKSKQAGMHGSVHGAHP